MARTPNSSRCARMKAYFIGTRARRTRSSIVLGPCMDGSGVTKVSVICGDWSGAAMCSASKLRFCPRAMMKSTVARVPINSTRSKALRSERGVLGLCPSVCHHLTLPSPFRSGREGPVTSCCHAARQVSPVLSMAHRLRTMRLASAMAASLSGLVAISRLSQSSPGPDRLRAEITPMAPR